MESSWTVFLVALQALSLGLDGFIKCVGGIIWPTLFLAGNVRPQLFIDTPDISR